MSIKEKNLNSIRPSMDVFCGIDMFDLPVEVTDENNFIDKTYTDGINKIASTVKAMDLSNGGFYNDGGSLALQTLYDDRKFGKISEYITNEDGLFEEGEEPEITFEWDYSEDPNKSFLTVFICDKNGNVYDTQFLAGEKENDKFTATLLVDNGPVNEHIYINKVAVGKSILLNKDNIISCDLCLRGITTDITDLNLQISEINLDFYDDSGDYASYSDFTDRSPIWFAAGYADDMSRIRKFYLSEPISTSILTKQNNELKGKILSIKGEDATKFLDGTHPGKIVLSNENTAAYNYWITIQDMLDDVGIDYETDGEFVAYEESGSGTQAASFLIPNKGKREILSEATKLFNNVDLEGDNCTLEYVDAGIPTLYCNREKTAYRITDYSDLQRTIKKPINEAKIKYAGIWVSDDTEELYSTETAGTIIQELAEPIYDVTTTGACTAELITPYVLKVVATGQGAVYGHKINFIYNHTGYTTDDSGYTSEVKADKSGESITLGEITGPFKYKYKQNATVNPIDNMFDEVLENKIEKYTFTWRGDPNLQPGDIIYLEDMYMRIDTIALQYNGGGLTSQIEATRIGGTYDVD